MFHGRLILNRVLFRARLLNIISKLFVIEEAKIPACKCEAVFVDSVPIKITNAFVAGPVPGESR